jgi:2-amino-4-hydroxy-6-hydroxymethyldihydropteridine diphosphokinase
MHWFPAYVGIGSNLHDPPAQVRRALAMLATLPDTRLVRASPLYGSTPLGPVAQPDFCNAVAALLTQQDLATWFATLRRCELELGREPARERWGPRVIDLDLLAFASQRHSDAQLTLPHPGIAARNFVLQPLCDVAPDLQIPGLGRVASLAARVSGAGLWSVT